MRTSVLLVALCCCGLALTAGAAASPTDESTVDQPTVNDSDGNETGGAGICVVGADSACNGERWDGDENRTDAGFTPSNGTDGTAGVGVCRVGVESPCNADRWESMPLELSEMPGGPMLADTLSRLFGISA